MKRESFSRRDFMKGCAVTGAFAMTGCGVSQKNVFAEGSKKPNVVLYVSDDHGIDELGCYGNKVIKTPHLDDLAAEGVRFTNAFCTTASCSASRSVILSGMYNHANGQYGHQHGYHHFVSFDKIKSLPVLLNQAGYRTGLRYSSLPGLSVRQHRFPYGLQEYGLLFFPEFLWGSTH